MPKRSGFAYVLAMFIPYAGRLGDLATWRLGGGGLLILVYVIGVLAAIAVPAYQDYTVRAKAIAAIGESQSARDALGNYYQTHQKVPETLDAIGIGSQLANGNALTLDPDNMALTVGTEKGQLIFTPSTDAQGRVTWSCAGGEGLKASQQLPSSCRTAEN